MTGTRNHNAPAIFHGNLAAQEVDRGDVQAWEEPYEVFDAAIGALDLAEEPSWILDSGCSRHISGNPEAFTSIDMHESPAVVQTASNQLLPVEGKGSVKLGNHAEININDVYFVPGLAFNLLSVGSIADMGFTLVFDDTECVVYQGKKVMGRGIRGHENGTIQVHSK
jgi:hypothetical protein